MIRTTQAKNGIAWLCLVAFVAALISPLQPTRVQAMETIDGAGFIEAEGEYLSGQGWTNSDKIELAIELITSGGTANFFLAAVATRYIIHLFFINVVRPIEVWLYMVQSWRYETGLQAVEEFRMMTLMLMDKRLDLAWFQAFCSELSVRQGWDHVMPTPWAFIHDEIGFDELDGFAPIGTGSSTPSNNASARTSSSAMNGPPIGPGSKARGMMDLPDSKAFEFWVNKMAKKGVFKKSLGIPGGNDHILLNLSYNRKTAKIKGTHGPDGFIINKRTGQCWTIESKNHKSGGGTLGKFSFTKKLSITQTDPGWLQKALLRIRQLYPAEYTKLIRDAGDTNFKRILLSVQKVDEHLADPNIAISNTARKRIVNFADPEEILEILRSKNVKDADIKILGNFWGDDYNVVVANRRGYKPTNIDDIPKAMKKWAAIFLARRVPGANRVRYAGVKKL